MLKHRYFISFFTTLIFYLSVIVTFFYFPNMHVGTEQKPKEQRLKLSLASFVKEEPIEVEAPLPPKVQKPISQPVVKEKPKTVPKKIKPKKVIPKKVVPKKPKPVKPRKKTKKKVQKKPTKKTSHTKTLSHKKTTTQHASKAKKSAFFQKLRANIDRHKMYPRIAQKRGMEGEVHVRFTILANGKVSHIVVEGRKVFLNSARRAVEAAFPISVKNIPITLPQDVKIKLSYLLR